MLRCLGCPPEEEAERADHTRAPRRLRRPAAPCRRSILATARQSVEEARSACRRDDEHGEGDADRSGERETAARHHRTVTPLPRLSRDDSRGARMNHEAPATTRLTMPTPRKMFATVRSSNARRCRPRDTPVRMSSGNRRPRCRCEDGSSRRMRESRQRRRRTRWAPPSRRPNASEEARSRRGDPRPLFRRAERRAHVAILLTLGDDNLDLHRRPRRALEHEDEATGVAGTARPSRRVAMV